MKLLLIGMVPLGLYLALVWYPNANCYPFGYPVQKGDLWEITFKNNEGTPIEESSTYLIRVDSVFEGYVMEAHNEKTGSNWGKSTMRSFTRTWPLSGGKAVLINRK